MHPFIETNCSLVKFHFHDTRTTYVGAFARHVLIFSVHYSQFSCYLIFSHQVDIMTFDMPHLLRDNSFKDLEAKSQALHTALKKDSLEEPQQSKHLILHPCLSRCTQVVADAEEKLLHAKKLLEPDNKVFYNDVVQRTEQTTAEFTMK